LTAKIESSTVNFNDLNIQTFNLDLQAIHPKKTIWTT